MEKKRGAEDGKKIVEEFESSGLTRRQFCERSHIPVTTLDYWRLRRARKAGLVEVAIAQEETAAQGSSAGFSVVLSNGRRIESTWSFGEAALSALTTQGDGQPCGGSTGVPCGK